MPALKSACWCWHRLQSPLLHPFLRRLAQAHGLSWWAALGAASKQSCSKAQMTLGLTLGPDLGPTT